MSNLFSTRNDDATASSYASQKAVSNLGVPNVYTDVTGW